MTCEHCGEASFPLDTGGRSCHSLSCAHKRIAALEAALQTVSDSLKGQNAALRAEVGRLREALECVASHYCTHCRAVARAALQPPASKPVDGPVVPCSADTLAMLSVITAGQAGNLGRGSVWATVSAEKCSCDHAAGVFCDLCAFDLIPGPRKPTTEGGESREEMVDRIERASGKGKYST